MARSLVHRSGSRACQSLPLGKVGLPLLLRETLPAPICRDHCGHACAVLVCSAAPQPPCGWRCGSDLYFSRLPPALCRGHHVGGVCGNGLFFCPNAHVRLILQCSLILQFSDQGHELTDACGGAWCNSGLFPSHSSPFTCRRRCDMATMLVPCAECSFETFEHRLTNNKL